MNKRTFCVAPMMDWTDRHERYFLRLISRRAWLYTEMVTTGALLHGDWRRYLAYHPDEHPVALQLGGNDPAALARCARMAEEAGYDEVNLNVGCPSDRVQGGAFGACLMAAPERVAECVAAMRSAVDIPVTVKNRIGIDDQDGQASLDHFVETVASAGCRTFIIHARKAWLAGLSPKENRDVPPLDYDRVYRIKADFPQLEIIINGGIRTLDEADDHLRRVDGVMLGREAYQNPYLLAAVDRRFYNEEGEPPSREAILGRLRPYLAARRASGQPIAPVIRHILGLYKGQYGGKAWRRALSESARDPEAGPEILDQAARCLQRAPSREAACAG